MCIKDNYIDAPHISNGFISQQLDWIPVMLDKSASPEQNILNVDNDHEYLFENHCFDH